METQQAAHPTPRQLAALALDRLTPAARERARAHVANCSTCADFLAKTPREALDMLLRQGGSSRSTADQSTPGDQAERGTISGVGAPLVDAASRRVSSSGGTPLLPAALAPESLPREFSQQTKYRIVRLLGCGGMGSVYEAHHTRMDRQQAIKVINPELVDNPQALLRFEEEIKAVAKLDHPNIARAYDAESFGSLQAIIMEFVPGQTLYEFLKARGRLSVMEACRCVRQALLGLQHAHDRGLVHRDLKPQNLMLARDTGLIKILDFGLAKVVSENRQSSGLTKTHVTMGTYEYMAPEQALDAATAGIRADIYSLGCTLYYLIAGVLPFAYDTDVKLLLAHQNETPRPLIEVRPEVPQAVSDLVARMLAKNPADRPQTPAEAAQALLPFAKSEAPAPSLKAPADVVGVHALACRASLKAELQRLLRRHRLPAALIGLALLGGIIVLGGLFKVRTADGTIALSVSQPDAEVLVDGQTITVNWGPDRKSAEITAPPGKHRIEIKKAGFNVSGKELTIEEGGHEVLSVSLETSARTVSAPSPDAKTLEENRGFFKGAVKPGSTANSSGATEPAVAGTGFVSLFNGKDLSGWSIDGGDQSGWSVDDGVIFARGVNLRSRNYLLTDREYSDYIMRLEFSLEAGAGAGVAVRAIPWESLPFEDGNKIFDHPIIKLIESPAKEQTGTTNWVLDRIHIAPDTAASLQPAGSWNRMEISAQGNRIQVRVNDELIVDASLPRDARFPDGTVPGLCRTNGRIGLQKHTGTVRFRNIEVKELPLNAAPLKDDGSNGDGAKTPASSTTDNGSKPNQENPVANGAERGAEARPIRALFVCGGCCHDYSAQKDIITKGISARANVDWTIAYDPDTTMGHVNPVYNNPDWSKGYDVVVHDECSSDVKDLGVINRILRPHRDGLPAVVIHCGLMSYRSTGFPDVTPWFEFTGMQTTGHAAMSPIKLHFIDKKGSITKGLADWTTIAEELYNNSVGKPSDTAHALATGAQAANRAIVAWTNEYRGKAKVFCTSIGHNNETCADPRYLDLVTRGLLWSVNRLDDSHLTTAESNR